jgi:hypothetical protein
LTTAVLTSANDRRVPTMLGWTPGVRTLVRGRVLPCGCVAGVYETWNKAIVTILDERHPACETAGHVTHEVLAREDPPG